MEFMNTTLTTKDLILAATPFILAVGYFLLNAFAYRKAKRQRETDPEYMTEEVLRVNRVYFIVSIGVLVGVIVLYAVVYFVIKLGVFN